MAMQADGNKASLPWWKGAVLYQVYPRSFQDSNGDGVGDLAGITQHMAYIAGLGVDGIWISPFFTSPMHDFGYDVADYCDVDPIFGTLADFDALIEAAHGYGLKVIIDQVYAHSSIDHPWFAQSRADRSNAKADWYVWADPNPDGTPPNNWQSVFGGPAWTWDARRRQYYMHTFLKEQPQLNVHEAQVQDALLDVARFWLDRGVDGFRLDALNHSMHDPLLRDNPPAPEDSRPRTRPFDYQAKLYSQSQPGVLAFIERIRALCDEYDAIFTVAEVGGDKAEEEQVAYTLGEHRLCSAYGFTFLYAPELTGELVTETLAQWKEGKGWPCWAFENHDAPRAVSRWYGKGDRRDAFVGMKMSLLLALRGNVIVYQGEELGLEQDDIPFELLRDPEAIANWPLTLSRDGCRTPMPWTGEEGGGFSTAVPWLPLGQANRARSVERQEGDDGSLLALTRRLVALRRGSPALRHGRMEGFVVKGAMLRFDRIAAGERLHCLFNLSNEPCPVPDPPPGGELWLSLNGADVEAPDGATLPPFGVLILRF